MWRASLRRRVVLKNDPAARPPAAACHLCPWPAARDWCVCVGCWVWGWTVRWQWRYCTTGHAAAAAAAAAALPVRCCFATAATSLTRVGAGAEPPAMVHAGGRAVLCAVADVDVTDVGRDHAATPHPSPSATHEKEEGQGARSTFARIQQPGCGCHQCNICH